MSFAMFKAWCAENKVLPVPANPAVVASFVEQIGHMGIEKVLEIVDGIAAAHGTLADPTTHPIVARAINEIAPIQHPNSWPKLHWAAFDVLPYRLKAYLATHDRQRELTVRKAHTEARDARDALRKHIEEKETA